MSLYRRSIADLTRGAAVALVNTVARLADKAVTAWPNLTGDDPMACLCGCGQPTRTGSDGTPRDYCKGHNPKPRRRTNVELFWAKVDRRDEDSCWPWTAALDDGGYGKSTRIAEVGTTQKAHRIAYVLLVGPIPEDLELDHLCRNRSCVNPAHLEPVLHAENQRRMAEEVTRCAHGHPYNEANTYYHPSGGRRCRTCNRERASRARVRAAADDWMQEYPVLPEAWLQLHTEVND